MPAADASMSDAAVLLVGEVHGQGGGPVIGGTEPCIQHAQAEQDIAPAPLRSDAQRDAEPGTHDR